MKREEREEKEENNHKDYESITRKSVGAGSRKGLSEHDDRDDGTEKLPASVTVEQI